jgi:putative transposase
MLNLNMFRIVFERLRLLEQNLSKNQTTLTTFLMELLSPVGTILVRDSCGNTHSDRGVQYVAIRYSDHLAEAGISPSVGSVSDSYDNALAETINDLWRP